MEIKTLSKNSLELIEQYTNFKFEKAHCSIPYYNNRKTKKRAALRIYIGKGSPKEIKEELTIICTKEKIDRKLLSNDSLKKILVDHEIGIECSGFSYHILNAESKSRGLGRLGKRIKFIKCRNLLTKIKCFLRPAENCDVETFSNNKNSKKIEIKDVLPGDMIIMTENNTYQDRNHILVINEVHYENKLPTKIIYTHSIAYPEDGIYHTGVRSGYIEIINLTSSIIEQKWYENNNINENNPLFNRVKNCKTELKRLIFF